MHQHHHVSHSYIELLGYELFGRSNLPDAVSDTFITLKNLLESLGLPINYKKVSAPTHKITCLGINIDAKQGTLSIPVEKMGKIIAYQN